MSRSPGRSVAAVLLAFGLLLAAPGAAPALEIDPSGLKMELLDGAGRPEVRAGTHPAALVDEFLFEEASGPREDIKAMQIDLPVGLGGNPRAVPLCPRRVYSQALLGTKEKCPPESQVGTLLVESNEPAESAPIYSMEPAPNELAVYYAAPQLPIKFVASMSPVDQRLSLRQDDLLQFRFLAVKRMRLELWGVPADRQAGTSIPRIPMLTMPTRCDLGPPLAALRAWTWQEPQREASAQFGSGHAVRECGGLLFSPRAAISFDNAVADAPSGARVELSIPQNEDPEGRATAQVRSIDFTMPAGTSLAPGGAAGMAACTDAQLGAGTEAEARCPAASRVGSVELSAPSLPRPLSGAVYLGQERPEERFRLFVVVSGSGIEVKSVGALRLDRATGRVSTSLDGLPQVAFDRLTLQFDGGPGALLSTPTACGRAPASASFLPYSGTAAVAWEGSVSVSGPGGRACAGPPAFALELTAGSVVAGAGKPTEFATTVRRRDGEQLPERLEIAFPPGMSARLGSVERCAALAAAGTCPPASRVGHAVAEIGPGAQPVRLDGDVYLTGPYRRAPFGLALVFAAKVGPFDLGKIVVRGALRVDPVSGRFTVATDPLPKLVEGVSVRFQTIGLDIDRPGFLRNPTSCEQSSAAASLRSYDGAVSRSETPFRARNCIDLPFRPGFSLALGGAMRRGDRPSLRISTRLPAGNANLRAADIALPALLKQDPSGLRGICARGEAPSGSCPASSRIGTASARTPLLKEPLRGSIFLVQPRGNGNPDVWTSLSGGGIEVNIKSEAVRRDGRLHTRLTDLPDLPISRLTQRFWGGKRGIFKLGGSLCRDGKPRHPRAEVSSEGQNRAERQLRVTVGVPGGCRE